MWSKAFRSADACSTPKGADLNLKEAWMNVVANAPDHSLEAAPDPKVFLQLAGGHNDGFIFMRPAWVEVLADFLDKHIVRSLP